jgi:hypothetical protein
VGNTGNASGGAAHLHLEIHNSADVPTNPFPRLTSEFSFQEKISYLSKILTQTSNSANLLKFVASNFPNTFIANHPTNTVANNINSIAITRNLYQGMSGEDVRTLQKLLNANGYIISKSDFGSLGNETTYFGQATKVAVIKFQIAKGISPAAGYVGSITRAALISL